MELKKRGRDGAMTINIQRMGRGRASKEAEGKQSEGGNSRRPSTVLKGQTR